MAQLLRQQCRSGYLLPGVVWQAGTGSKHGAVVLDGEMLQLGPERLLLLRHHAVSSTLRRKKKSLSQFVPFKRSRLNEQLLLL